MKQAYTLPTVAVGGAAITVPWRAPRTPSLPARLARFPLGIARTLGHLTLGLFKWLVLLPLAIVLALCVWLSVRLIRG